MIRYLKGETVEAEGKDGWTLVCVDGFPLGWAKRQKGRLKNKYAVSWKWE
ncbi:MAG: methyltransferase RsmF C-terminal domain-like protein [Anaerotignum faecicola]